MTFPPARRAASITPSAIRRLYDARRPTSINFGLGDPALPISLELLDEGVARFREHRPGYTLNAGMLDLREAIARMHGLPHLPSAKNCVITVGATGGLFAAFNAVADVGEEIVISDPAFLNYATTLQLCGLVPKRVPLRRDAGFALDVEAIAAAITPRTRAVLLNSPCNPTGRVDRREELAALVAATERAGVWLISDEVYREIAYVPVPSVAELTDRAIVVSALSKSASMTGFRLGYVLAPEPLAKAIASVQQFQVTSAPTLSQHVAAVAVGAPDKHLRGNLSEYVARRSVMREELHKRLGLPFVDPDGGFFVFVDVRALRRPTQQLAEQLLAEADVVTVPGSAFGENGEGFLRLSFAVSPEHVREGVRRIEQWVRTTFPG